MQDAAATTALADGLEEQQFALRREVERLLSLCARVSTEPTNQSWRGLARNAFDNQLAVLQRGLAVALAALEEAVANTARARESLLSRGG